MKKQLKKGIFFTGKPMSGKTRMAKGLASTYNHVFIDYKKFKKNKFKFTECNEMTEIIIIDDAILSENLIEWTLIT